MRFWDPVILKWASLNWKPVLSWQQEPIMVRLVPCSPTFRLLFGRYNSKHQSNVTESKVCASRIIQASVMGTWRKFSPQGDWPRWKCKHLYIFPANVDLHLNKDPLVKDNLFLLRDLLSFWVGSSLSLFWEGNNQKHRRHWSYMRDLIYMFIKHKKLYLTQPKIWNVYVYVLSLQNMQYQTRLFDFRISSLHTRSSPHPLHCTLGSSSCLLLLRSGSYLTTRSSKNRAQGWNYLLSIQIGAGAINIIMLPSILIPVTWFPEHKGLVGKNTKILFLSQIN